MLIPKPFATVHALTGQPIAVRPNLSRAELLEAQTQVQAAMDAINAEADRLLNEPGATLQTHRRKRLAA